MPWRPGAAGAAATVLSDWRSPGAVAIMLREYGKRAARIWAAQSVLARVCVLPARTHLGCAVFSSFDRSNPWACRRPSKVWYATASTVGVRRIDG